jgi:HSP20 family protein
VTHRLKQLTKDNKMSYYIKNSYNNIFNNLFDDLFDSIGSKRRANIISREKEIEIQLECPGLTKKDIDLSFEKGLLKVICNSQESVKQQYLHHEFSQCTSTNQFKLKDELDTNKITASCENGILYINIPRKKQCQAKRIEIK